MILEEIKTQLETVNERVFYGLVDESVKDTVWNYIVFNRTNLGTSPNKTGYTDYFDVHIVFEDFVPEGIDEEVIKKLCSINGVRLSTENGSYDYTLKPNTNIVVEVLTLHFMRARK